ncbi:MAG: hypothetical protein H7Y13_14245 [Sphingobacteriaceae bacterium]|nr:hypothetical protein [Sphingobacteriaceae bacterium]
MNTHIKTLTLFILTGLYSQSFAQSKVPDISDMLILGNSASEKSHQLQPIQSETLKGGLNESARRLLPVEPASWQGGKLVFTMKVDPGKQNYFTAKFWGSDTNPNRLILFCDGKQIGYRHLGDIDILDIGGEEPVYNGRFFYNTTPLPISLTKGKTELRFEIRGNGPIWGYGTTFEQYQKPMTVATRGIYRAYTHTEGCFSPASDEKQGLAPTKLSIRKNPGEEVITKVKDRVNKEISTILNSKQPISQQQMQFLSKAFHVKWTAAYQNKDVVRLVVEGGDSYFQKYKQDNKLALSDPKQYNAGWFGVGPMGDALRQLKPQIQPFLNEKISDGKFELSRKEAWSGMMQYSRDNLRRTRPHYTNQTMIQDMNIYLINRGIEAIDPAHALPEEQAKDYMYQAIGIVPWLGRDTDAGPSKHLGDNYYQLTAKGLTKELGYVGNYGEVLDWVTHIFLATKEPGNPNSGDQKIRAQLSKMEHARSKFRYPSQDEEGNRAMRMETVVGWRDTHYPGEVTYAERSAWEGSAIYSVAANLDPASVGFAQQMFEDNQFFQSVESLIKSNGLRVTNTLLWIPDQYEVLKAQPKSKSRLPMSWDQPDFAWADEEDGVLALKHGDEILYASLYWRSRYAVNSLARIHYITPRFDRIAVVKEDTKFETSGDEYTRKDWVNMGFGNGGHSYPAEIHSAHAGEKLPIAKVPQGVKFKPGDENIYAGKADFYTCSYGKYLIGMNSSADKTFELEIPKGYTMAPDLVSGKTFNLSAPVKIAPRSTVVLYLAK